MSLNSCSSSSDNEPYLHLLVPRLYIPSGFVTLNLWDSDQRNRPYLYYDDSFQIDWTIFNYIDTNHNGRAFGVSSYLDFNTSLLSQNSGYIEYRDILNPYNSIPGNYMLFTANNTSNYTDIINIIAYDSSGLINYTYSVNAMLLNLTSEIVIPKDPLLYGKETPIYIHVKGNATEINDVVINITYLEYNGSGFVKNYDEFYYPYDIILLNYTEDYTLNQTPESWFLLNYIPDHSGMHNITTTVYAYKNATAKSSFFASQGRPEPEIVGFPNYYILSNQTFNTTFSITAIDGDIFDFNISLESSDNQTLNIISNKTMNYSDFLENGTTKEYAFTIHSNKTGLAFLTLNMFWKNHTLSKQYYFKIVQPIIETGNDTITYNSNQTFTIKILGNSTPVQYQEILLNYSNNQGNELINEFSLINSTSSKYCIDESSLSNTTDLASLSRGAYVYYHQGYISESPNNSIDDYTSSYWWGKSNPTTKAMLNITFNRTGTIGSLSFLIKSYGDSNISVYYASKTPAALAETEGTISWKQVTSNSRPLIIHSNSTQQKIELNTIDPFETNKISIVVETENTDTLIYEFNATTIKKELNEVCYIYRTDIENASHSGTTNITYKYQNQNNDTSFSKSSYFVTYGIPQIQIDAQTIIWKNSEISQIYARIYAENGDLKNVNVSFNISNTSVIDYNESKYKSISFIRNGDMEIIIWNVTTPPPIPSESKITNISIFANNTINLKTSNHSSTVKVIKEDKNLLNITHIYMDSNKTNLYRPLNMTIEIQEDIYIDKIILNYNWLNYTQNQTEIISKSVNGTLNFTITTNPDVFNSTANYSIYVYATDYNGTRKYENPVNLTTTTTLYLTRKTNYTKFNRGENVTYFIEDINGKNYTSLTNYSYILVYEYNDTTYNVTKNDTTSNGVINIQLTKNLNNTNYTLLLNASSYGNNQNTTLKLNLSDKLDYVLLIPNQENRYHLKKGKSFGDIYDIILKLLNSRNETIISNSTLNYTLITCLNSSMKEHTIQLDFGTTALYENVLYSLAGFCYAPDEYDKSFFITLNVSDVYNNTVYKKIEFKTEENPDTPQSGGGGGSNNVGTSSSTISGNYPLPISQEPQKRVIIYANDTADIDIDFVPQTVTITQGDTKEITLIIKNKKNMSINGTLEIRENIDDIVLDKHELFFKTSGQKEIKIFIKTKLTSPLGTNKFKIVYNTNEGDFFNIFSYKTNKNKIVQDAIGMIYPISQVKEELKELIKDGIQKDDLKQDIFFLNQKYYELTDAINHNDLKRTQQIYEQINEKLNQIKEKKRKLMYVKTLKTYKYYMLAGSIILAIIIESFIIYFIPLLLLIIREII